MLSPYTDMKYSREPDAGENVLLNHCLFHNTSYQALVFLREDRELEVRHNASGWYLGCAVGNQLEDVAFYRDSEYFESETAAREALDSHSWTQRLDP
jgi:hypothetical protein